MAGPGAVFLLVFRRELAKVVQRLARLKYKDLEVDFEKVQQEVKELQPQCENLMAASR